MTVWRETRARFAGAPLAALLLAAACTADVAPPSSAIDPAAAELELRGGYCRTDRDCPQPGAPCFECSDGSTACPEVECVRRRCVFRRAECPAYEPCAGLSCGDQCRVCDPRDLDCVETQVIKYCQADGSCAPEAPSCELENPCAAVLCPVGTQCVVLESFPPQARCVPVDNSCAAVLCPTGTRCEAGRCIPLSPPVFCGGIAGLRCPGAGTCVDDPNDGCDPRRGGADCGGACECNALGLCGPSFVWDSSPSVCGCVPVGGGECGGSHCGPGQYCCNASCGICAPKGGACIQIACEAAQ